MPQITAFIEKPDGWYGPDIDPDDEKDYELDFTDLLDGDTISSVSWATSAGITAYSPSNTTTTATTWLKDATANVIHDITVTVITAAGRTFERSFRVHCKEL